MFQWASRETRLDVSINVVPMVILAYFVVVFALPAPWEPNARATVLTHGLTIFPVVVLAFATYYVARAIERDARRR